MVQASDQDDPLVLTTGATLTIVSPMYRFFFFGCETPVEIETG